MTGKRSALPRCPTPPTDAVAKLRSLIMQVAILPLGLQEPEISVD